MTNGFGAIKDLAGSKGRGGGISFSWIACVCVFFCASVTSSDEFVSECVCCIFK